MWFSKNYTLVQLFEQVIWFPSNRRILAVIRWIWIAHGYLSNWTCLTFSWIELAWIFITSQKIFILSFEIKPVNNLSAHAIWNHRVHFPNGNMEIWCNPCCQMHLVYREEESIPGETNDLDACNVAFSICPWIYPCSHVWGLYSIPCRVCAAVRQKLCVLNHNVDRNKPSFLYCNQTAFTLILF